MTWKTLRLALRVIRTRRAQLCVSAVFVCCTSPFGFQTAEAQQKDELKGLREDVATLKRDVSTLGQQLQQTIEKINGLANLATRESDSLVLDPPVAATVDLRGLPFKGSVDAPVVIVEYADFECPFCLQYKNEVYPQIFENYIKTGKVRYFWHDFPLPMHSHALWAALVARCAEEQGKFWEMRDRLYSDHTGFRESALFGSAQSLGMDTKELGECISTGKYIGAIRLGISDAQGVGIDRTPTFFLGTVGLNGHIARVTKAIRGAYPYEVFRSNLDGLLAAQRRDP